MVMICMGLDITKLPVANYMTPYPITVDADVTVLDAVELMVERGFGNLIVDNGLEVEGLFTEREILQAIIHNENLSKMRIRDSALQPFSKINLDTSILNASSEMIQNKKRLLVFDDDKLIGITTSSDLMRAFRKTVDAPTLDKVTSNRIFTCSSDDAILQAVKIMHENNIGSVILKDITGWGIFTERDLLVHVLTNDVDLSGKVGQYSTTPLIMAAHDVLANEAANTMAGHNIKRLGLIKDGELAGVVTAKDIVSAFYNFYFKSNPYVNELSYFVKG